MQDPKMEDLIIDESITLIEYISRYESKEIY
jgi:hypothetical protein